jgi:hypothetical protein
MPENRHQEKRCGLYSKPARIVLSALAMMTGLGSVATLTAAPGPPPSLLSVNGPDVALRN